MLLKDYDFIREKIPDTFNFGMFHVDLKEYKTRIIKNIESYYIPKLEECKYYCSFVSLNAKLVVPAILERLNEILKNNKTMAEEILTNLKRVPKTILDYKIIQEDIESQHFSDRTKKIDKELEICRTIMDYMESFYVGINEYILNLYYESKGWIPLIAHHRQQCYNRLQESRPRFIAELKEKSKEIFKELNILKDEVANFANFYDLNNSYTYYTTARDVQERLDTLLRTSQEVNEYEKILKHDSTDFSAITSTLEIFDKYYKLWDYVYDQWQTKTRDWLTQRFEDLNEQDMHDTIKKGLKLLRHLEEQFKYNANIVVR